MPVTMIFISGEVNLLYLKLTAFQNIDTYSNAFVTSFSSLLNIKI